MKKSTKVLLGIATCWPFVYIPLFIMAIFSMILLAPQPGSPPDDAFPLMFLLIMPVHMLTILGGLALTVFYIVNVFRNKRVEKDKQVMWVLLFFFVGMFAQPIYWYQYIWKDDPREARNEPPALNNADAANWTGYASSNRREPQYAPPPQPPPPHGWQG